jgi:hypothetical protein
VLQTGKSFSDYIKSVWLERIVVWQGDTMSGFPDTVWAVRTTKANESRRTGREVPYPVCAILNSRCLNAASRRYSQKTRKLPSGRCCTMRPAILPPEESACES